MKSALLGLATGATLSLVAPILLPLPKPVATASLLLSMGLGGALSALAKQYERPEAIKNAMFETNVLQPLREDMARQRTQQSLASAAAAKLEILTWADQYLPPELQAIALAEFGLKPLNTHRAITTTAKEVVESAPVQVMPTQAVAMMERPAVYGEARQRVTQLQQRSPIQQPPQSVLPIEDLARTYALMTRSGSTFRNVMMPAEPGTGKSTFICAVIHHLNDVHQGHVDMTVFAGKLPDPQEDPGYCGLEQSPEDFLFSGDYRAAVQTVKRLKAITELTTEPGRDYPTIAIQDEMNNTLDALKMFDKTPDASIYGKQSPQALALNDMRLTQGRSRRVGDFVTSHSRLVKDVGYNTSKQHAFDWIVPGRYPMAMNTIRQSICADLIPDERDRLRLEQDLIAFLDSPSEGVVALTNLGGNWRLVQLPDYRSYVRPIERGILNQSGEELAEEFKEDVWEDKPEPQPPQDNDRLVPMLLDTIARTGAFNMPKQQALGIIATKAREFWAQHGKAIAPETATEMAEYLWNLKENGQLDSLTGTV